MSSPRDSYECYECPQEFQDRLTEVGGRNKYDQPNFLVVWGQGGQEECLYRAGGSWHVPGEPTFTGYRDLLIGGGARVVLASVDRCTRLWDTRIILRGQP